MSESLTDAHWFFSTPIAVGLADSGVSSLESVAIIAGVGCLGANSAERSSDLSIGRTGETGASNCCNKRNSMQQTRLYPHRDFISLYLKMKRHKDALLAIQS